MRPNWRPRASVWNGNLLVGMACTGLPCLKPGDAFAIKLGKKQIRLIPAGSAEEE
jgi:hypothetical protein